MAVNKVEYKLDSLQSGFAVAGDEVTIKKDNAEIIKQDADENRTNDLTNGQTKFLERTLSGRDNNEYEGLDGDMTIPDDSDKGSTGRDKLGTVGAMGASAAGAWIIADAAAVAAESTVASVSTTAAEATSALENLTAASPFMNSFTAVAIGAADLALGTASGVWAALFDSNYSERMSTRSVGDESISSMEEYMSVIDDEFKLVDEILASENPPDISESESAEVSIQDKIAELEAKLEEAKANGDEELVAQLEKEINALSNGGEIKEKLSPDELLEKMIGTNQEIHDLNDFATDVSSFLKQGTNQGIMATINTVALTSCAAVSTVLSVLAFTAANVFTIPNALAGAGMCVAGGALFLGSSIAMGFKAANEYKCGEKGNAVADALETKLAKLPEHDSKIESLTQYIENISAEEDNDDSGVDSGNETSEAASEIAAEGSEGGDSGSSVGGSSGGDTSGGGSSVGDSSGGASGGGEA